MPTDTVTVAPNQVTDSVPLIMRSKEEQVEYARRCFEQLFIGMGQQYGKNLPEREKWKKSDEGALTLIRNKLNLIKSKSQSQTQSLSLSQSSSQSNVTDSKQEIEELSEDECGETRLKEVEDVAKNSQFLASLGMGAKKPKKVKSPENNINNFQNEVVIEQDNHNSDINQMDSKTKALVDLLDTLEKETVTQTIKSDKSDKCNTNSTNQLQTKYDNDLHKVLQKAGYVSINNGGHVLIQNPLNTTALDIKSIGPVSKTESEEQGIVKQAVDALKSAVLKQSDQEISQQNCYDVSDGAQYNQCHVDLKDAISGKSTKLGKTKSRKSRQSQPSALDLSNALQNIAFSLKQRESSRISLNSGKKPAYLQKKSQQQSQFNDRRSSTMSSASTACPDLSLMSARTTYNSSVNNDSSISLLSNQDIDLNRVTNSSIDLNSMSNSNQDLNDKSIMISSANPDSTTTANKIPNQEPNISEIPHAEILIARALDGDKVAQAIVKKNRTLLEAVRWRKSVGGPRNSSVLGEGEVNINQEI